MLRNIFRVVIFLGALLLNRASAQPAPPAGPDDQPDASRWPMTVPSASGDIIVFQPQLESFQGDQLVGRAAVEVPTSDPNKPTYGVIWLQSRVDVDRVARTVHILDVNVTKTDFPDIDDPQEKQLAEQVRQAIAAQPITLSLDQLLESVQTLQQQQQEKADLQTAPPAIVFRDHPAVLVEFDGPPKMLETQTPGLLRAQNTPFFVVLDSANKTYFLKGAGLWFAAPDALGPYQSARDVPSDVAQLADAMDYKDPQTPLSPQQSQAIEIVTAAQPTELIWTDGQPQMTPIKGTNLLYVTNTDSDWFIDVNTQTNYLLLSGRWYSSRDKSGPWTWVAPEQLPADFAKIPPNSDKGDVLAQVPNTPEADDAIADNQIPETAAIDRHNFDQPTVDYDGDPQFDPLQDAGCSYAVNTEQAVVQVGPDYYCCQDAVWYVGHSPRGPWDICTRVPQECYRLPPSCPLYPCTYVHVYGFTPDVCYVGYTPGYMGSYVFHHCVVYGTGYHYRPWVGKVYYSRPHTFGFAARYNAYMGHWGFSFGLATGHSGGSWIGNGPHAWGRSGRWFGFGGYRPVVLHSEVHRSLFRDEYATRVRGTSAVRPVRNDQYGRSVYDRRHDVRWATPQARQTEHRTGEHAAAPAVRHEDVRNNVFSDRDGHVYRRTDNGWEMHDRNGWQARPEEHAPTAAPRAEEHGGTAPPPRIEQPGGAVPAPRVEPRRDTGAELNRDLKARQRGE